MMGLRHNYEWHKRLNPRDPDAVLAEIEPKIGYGANQLLNAGWNGVVETARKAGVSRITLWRLLNAGHLKNITAYFWRLYIHESELPKIKELTQRRGRPAKYANAADRQKAYRERKANKGL